jgi:hypothetical protein
VQLALPGAAEMFAAAGLETLPLGASEMSRKQLLFAVAYLNCGNARQAARETGYNDDNASKLLENNAISRFLNAATKTVAQNGDQLVRRKWELSVSLHRELMEIRAQDKAAKTPADLKRESKLERMVNRTDMLLAAMLNRLGIKLTGDVNVNHTATAGGDQIVIPPDALAGFAVMRAEVAAGNRVAALQAEGKN